VTLSRMSSDFTRILAPLPLAGLSSIYGPLNLVG
jgi:hypothetical protein